MQSNKGKKTKDSPLTLQLFFIKKSLKKMPQRRDNAGAVCDSIMGMLFLTPFFLERGGGLTNFLLHDTNA